MFARPVILAIALLAPAAQAQNNSSPQPPADPQEMSLAEKAAAARKAAPPRAHDTESSSASALFALTPEQHGEMKGNRYVNNFLHFQIDLGNRWTPLSAERMAHDEEVGRKYVNPNAGSSPNRVLWVKDGAGCNFSMSIVAPPPDAPTDLDQLAGIIKSAAVAQLVSVPEIQQSAEQIRLGNAAHRFAAFRLAYTLRNTPITQSAQLTRSNGFLIVVTTTCGSDQALSDALGSLKSSLTWTAAKP